MVTLPPTPPRSMLFSREQKSSGHTSTLFFFKGRESILSKPDLEVSILKLDLQGAFFLTFLSKIVGSLPAQDGRPQEQVLVSYDLTEK